jgi:chromosomal replication initiation ATPase DnaA
MAVEEVVRLRALVARLSPEVDVLRAALHATQHELDRLRVIAAAGSHYAQMLAGVAQRRGVAVMDLRGPCRTQILVQARAEFASLARDDGATLDRIGAVLGGRDHSTVNHLIKLGRLARAREAAAQGLEGQE